MSNEPPEISMPVPTGALAEIPLPGTFGLLLSCTWLFWITVQSWVVVPGQRPLCGEGASSLLSELGRMPTRLLSHSEFWIVRWPPELVPEYPSGLFSAWTWSSVVLQSGHAPT